MTSDKALPELAEGWEWSTLGDIFSEVKNGTTASQNKEGRGVPVTRIETVQNARFDFRRIGYVDDAPPALIRTFQYQQGDIALSHINSLEHVGKTALYESVPEILLHGMNLLRLRLGHDNLNPQFVHAAMQGTFFRDEVRGRVGRAVNQVSINQKRLAEIPIPIAPLVEQPRLVAKLAELFVHVNSARDHLSRVPAILKRFRQAVRSAACSGRLTEDWRHSRRLESGVDLLHRLRVASKVVWESTGARRAGRRSSHYIPPQAAIIEGAPEIPDQWTWASPEELIDYERRHSLAIGPFGSNLKVSDYKAQGTPLVFVRNIRSQSFADTKYVSKEKADELRAHWTQPGDILITKMGDPPGDACLYPNGRPTAVITADCIKMRVSSLLTEPMFFVHAINSGTVRDQILQITMGVAQPKVSLERFRRIAIPLPPIEEQGEITRRVEALLALADFVGERLTSAILRSDKLTQSILAKAFRGELVPTEAELARREGRDYEPASVLLERIRAERANQAKTPAVPKRRLRKAIAHV